jgi:hypothetical protein
MFNEELREVNTVNHPRLVEAPQSFAMVDSPSALAPSLERRAEAGARGLADLIERERRTPTLVEIRAIIARFMGHAGSLSVREGEALIHALQELLSSGRSSQHDQGTLRATTEIIFHHYPNSLNASPS